MCRFHPDIENEKVRGIPMLKIESIKFAFCL